MPIGPKPKMPVEKRQDLIDEINRMDIDPDALISILLSNFTTIDLLGIIPQLKKEARGVKP